MSYGRLYKFAENVLERQAILELLVLSLFRPFNGIEFSINSSLQKCFIFVKAF